MSSAVCTHFKKEGVVVPTGIHKSVFTTGAVDNIDYNPSLSTAKGSFHRTGISLFQHPDFDGQRQAMEPIEFSSWGASDHLSDFYLKVHPVTKLNSMAYFSRRKVRRKTINSKSIIELCHQCAPPLLTSDIVSLH